MKRILLSCLTVLFAVLFVASASAQRLPNEPGNAPTPADAKFKGAKHMWVCQGQATPLSLEWDVAGKGLSLSNGTWSAVYPSNPLPTDIYENTNIFKVIGAPVGTYVFQYKVNDDGEFCGLKGEEYVWIYVHVVPTLSNGNSNPTNVCVGQDLTTTGFEFNAKKYLDAQQVSALEAAGYVVEVTPATLTAAMFPTASEGTKTKKVTVEIKLPTPNTYNVPVYTCGTASFEFTIVVNVNKEINITGTKPESVCLSTIDPTTTAANIFDYFGVDRINVATMNWTTVPSGQNAVGGEIDFSKITAVGTLTWVLAYTDCSGTTRTVTFVLTVSNTTISLDDKDASYCKDGISNTTIDLSEQYKLAAKIGSIPNVSGFNWSYIGIKADGTQHSNASLNPTINTVDGRTFPISQMASNTQYFFKITASASAADCFAGENAIFTLKLQNATVSGDERMSVCKDDNTDVNFADLFNIYGTVTWAKATGHAAAPNINATTSVVLAADIKAANEDTYQYTYNKPFDNTECGYGNGKIYLTISDNPIASKLVDKEFCIETLDDEINLFNLLGVFATGAWSGTYANATYLDANGILQLKKLYQDRILNGSDPLTTEYEFTFTGGAGCLNGKNYTVKIKFTNIIMP